jgi:hypothetical protein
MPDDEPLVKDLPIITDKEVDSITLGSGGSEKKS